MAHPTVGRRPVSLSGAGTIEGRLGVILVETGHRDCSRGNQRRRARDCLGARQVGGIGLSPNSLV